MEQKLWRSLTQTPELKRERYHMMRRDISVDLYRCIRPMRLISIIYHIYWPPWIWPNRGFLMILMYKLYKCTNTFSPFFSLIWLWINSLIDDYSWIFSHGPHGDKMSGIYWDTQTSIDKNTMQARTACGVQRINTELQKAIRAFGCWRVIIRYSWKASKP